MAVLQLNDVNKVFAGEYLLKNITFANKTPSKPAINPKIIKTGKLSNEIGVKIFGM